MTTGTALTPLPTAALPAELADRLDRYAQQAEGALADETVRALRNDTRLFASWCADAGRVPLPADPDTVAGFVDAMATAGRAPASIRRYVASIAHQHRAAGAADPAKADAVKLALKRMARAKGTRQRQATPITADAEAAILATLGDSLRDRRDAALLLVARDLLARRSEAVALELADLTFDTDAAGSATALIRRSKTDQTGQGVVLHLAPATATALRRWLAAAGITSGAVFRSVNRHGAVGEPLHAVAVGRIFKKLAAAAGLDPTGISGHSARVGMAQDLVAAGEDLPAIMQAGRWASPAMPARYAAHQRAARTAVARFRANNR